MPRGPRQQPCWIILFACTWLFCHSPALLSQDTATKPAPDLLQMFVNEFVAITPGEGKFPAVLQMGSTFDPSEQPRHDVTISGHFAIARYEVPQNLYQLVMKTNPSRWKGPRNSVEMMSWNDANDFCQKITEMLHDRKLISADEVIRLPTEAEWEYCCRSGTTTRFSFGDDAVETDSAKAKYDVVLTGAGDDKESVIKEVRAVTGLGLKQAQDLVNSLPRPLKKGLSKEDADKLKEKLEAAGGTVLLKDVLLLDTYGWHNGNAAGNDPPVGALKPNSWGLYDMHGYLWEFTADGWSDDYAQTPADGSAQKADPEKGSIVLRGGSWKSPAARLTSSARQKYPVNDADDAVGFRCVKSKMK